MTGTTETVFEKYQIRKTKKQKTTFIDFVKSVAEEGGYPFHTEKGAFGSRNIVVGDVQSAEFVCAAHYDTCATLPFPNFITPKNFAIYLLYQIAIVLGIFLIEFLLGFAIGVSCSLLGADISAMAAPIGLAVSYALLIAVVFLMIAGPANRHTANDNTSGVTVLLDVMTSLPDDIRGKVAFVFFDLEEAGLIGSMSFASKHKKLMKSKPLINFDCVSDGDNMLFVVRPGARALIPLLEECFQGDGSVKSEVAVKGVFYPSDQMSFPMGIGVASMRRSEKLGISYIGKIHTNRDTVYREENIRFLRDGVLKFAEKI